MPDRHACPFLQRCPLLDRPSRELRIDLVCAVATAQNARLVARAGAWVGRTVCINERNVAACGEEMMRGPRTEYTGSDDDDQLRHEAILVHFNHEAAGAAHRAHARSGDGACRAARAWPSALPRLWPPVPYSRGRDGRVQSAV